MRLFLRIFRHSLPRTRLVWDIPPHISDTCTIADLLEQVNDVIPLESGDWGLEDYNVECSGYDLLHFQVVDRVLNDADVVDIRPYTSKELQLRKFAGRTQISADGKHLIDGVAFGRPYVGRMAHRPAVYIPPRKRRRLELADSTCVSDRGMDPYDDDDEDEDDDDDGNDDESEYNSQALESSGQSYHSRSSSHDTTTEELEDESASEGARQQEAAAELEDLALSSDNEQDDKENHGRKLLQQEPHSVAQTGANCLILPNGMTLELVDEDGRPFPTLYRNELLDKYEKLSRAHSTTKSLPEREDGGLEAGGALSERSKVSRSSQRSGRAGVRKATKTVRFDAHNALPSLQDAPAAEGGDAEDEELRDSGVNGDEAEDGSRGNDGEVDAPTASAPPQPSSPLSSAQPSPSSSSPAKTPRKKKVGAAQMTPPGHGRSKTKRRNKRRRLSKSLENSAVARTNDALQEQADGQSDNGKTTDSHTLGESSEHGEDSGQFEARRQALLAAIASGGVEVGGSIEDGPTATAEPRVEKDQRVSDSQDTLSWQKPDGVQQASADATAKSKSRPQAAAPPGNRRPKVDLPSSRRLLMGALGLPSPKKAKIAAGPHSTGAAGRAATPRAPKRIVFDADGLNPVVAASAEQQDGEGPAADAAADANWEGKIALAAEECCKDGVTLTAPPFPFAQRWDPQQKLPSYKQKKGEQKRKRYQPEDYEDDEHYHDDGAFEDAFEDAAAEAGTNGHDAAPAGKERSGNTDEPAAPSNETGEIEADDDDDDDGIPAVPSNLSDCPSVNFTDLQVGAIIAFKRLVMTTNWQPELSEHQTGRVKILDGDMLEIELAKHYRQRREKKYDEEGRRVYGRFEGPDDEEFDQGKEEVLTLCFSDLVDPRLVQGPAENAQQEGCSMTYEAGPDEHLELLRYAVEAPHSNRSCAPGRSKIMYPASLRVFRACSVLRSRRSEVLWCRRAFTTARTAAMAQQYKLKLDSLDLQHLEKREVEVEGIDGAKVLLVKLGDQVHALSPNCTHYGAPLVKGVITPDGRLTCAWHGACFHVGTGDVEDSPALDPLAKFEVSERDGAYYITGEESRIKASRGPGDIKCAVESPEKVVIVGGGSGTIGAIEGLRKGGFKGSITVISREPYPPIDRTKLSKALIPDAGKIVLRNQAWLDQASVVIENDNVSGVDFAAKRVLSSSGRQYPYTKLILATGGTPRRLPLPGFKDLNNIFTLRTVADVQAILAAVGENKGKDIVVVGSSFIGMEVANCLSKGNNVTVVGMEKAPMARIMGEQVGNIFRRLLEDSGVKFHLDVGVDKATPAPDDSARVGAVHLANGTQLRADLVILGVGVAPATEFLKDNPAVQLQKDGSLKTDENFAVEGLQGDVYAVGDIATHPYLVGGGSGSSDRPATALTRIEHWNVAQNGGRSVGALLSGARARPKPFVPTFWSALGKQLRYCGNAPDGFDDVVVQGRLDEAAFAAFYTRGDTVVAVATMQKDPVMSKSAELMRRGAMPSKLQLQQGADVLQMSLPAEVKA